jgi:hypothetical protein
MGRPTSNLRNYFCGENAGNRVGAVRDLGFL